MLATHLTHLRVPVWSAVLIVSVACSPVAWGDEVWPGFNGPRHNNQSDCRGLPLTWNETDNITWKTPIHDSGWSTPVIWGNQVWVTTATDDGKQSFALCLDRATGKVLHDLKLWDNAEPENTRQYNSFASSTPAIEEGRIYVHFGSYGTACLDTATAQVLWTRRDLPCQHFRGPGSSPLLAGDRLYIHYDGFDQQYIVALDKHTGKTVWQKKREVDYGTDNGDVKKAYATPLLFESQGRKMLASPTSKACLVLDPETGAELWRVRYAGFSGAARPLWGDGLLYLFPAAGGRPDLRQRLQGKNNGLRSRAGISAIGRESTRGRLSCLPRGGGESVVSADRDPSVSDRATLIPRCVPSHSTPT